MYRPTIAAAGVVYTASRMVDDFSLIQSAVADAFTTTSGDRITAKPDSAAFQFLEHQVYNYDFQVEPPMY
jgi:hypothetical protein